MVIFIIGQTTLHWGRMEFGNIGNYYIIEPFIRELHRIFPGSLIKTTLQMSERFSKDENVSVLPMDLYYGFEDDDLDKALSEFELVNDYNKNGYFAKSTPYIREVMSSDLIIDFSGDIWGDNANLIGKNRFKVGLYKDRIAQLLGKPTFLIAGTTGPFSDKDALKFAHEVLKNFTLVTNRESISEVVLKENGFDTSNVVSLACPAFLFEDKASKYKIKEILKNEGILLDDKPLVGFILCGWNFEKGPFDRYPREDDEYIIFAKAIEFITNNLHARVCLMSHSNGFPIPPEEFKLIHGRDYNIIKQLEKVIKNRGITSDIYVLNGVYDAWTTKGIIGSFDMLVSGRIHAAVAALSKSVPTVILDYGHEPKAHKLRGFTEIVKMEDYLCNPVCTSEIINKIQKCWSKRDEIKDELDKIIPEVQDMARKNFELIRDKIDSLNKDR